MCIAAGEVSAVSASYEVAFAIAPKEQKIICSGMNLFLTAGLANFICGGLNQICKAWFPQDSTSPNSNVTEEYVNSKIGLYFLVLLGIQIIGIILNVTPFICNWVERLRKEASDADEIDSNNIVDKDSGGSVMTPDTAEVPITSMRRDESRSSLSSLQSMTV